MTDEILAIQAYYYIIDSVLIVALLGCSHVPRCIRNIYISINNLKIAMRDDRRDRHATY